MSDLEQSLEELEVVKQNFKSNFNSNDVATTNVEFRNYPNLMLQLEKKLPSQTKTITPSKESQSVKADDGYKLGIVNIDAIPSQYIEPSGTLLIEENGTFDVTNYANAEVDINIVTPSGIKTITENGSHNVENYAWAEVNVQPNLQEKTVTVNGEVVADSGYDGLSKVTVNVPSEEPTLITKEITENGTYKASDDGADGYSEVVVNVASSGGGKFDITQVTLDDGTCELQIVDAVGGSGGGDATPKIYGVSWTNDESTTMTRTDDAVGMSYSITNGRVTSDFDKVFPYNQMKRTVIDGNTFVFVPAMWFRVITDADKKITSVAVSSVKGEGDDWYPTRPFYYGAYGASSDGTVLKSVSGASRLYLITRQTARTRAMAVGEKYHQRDLYSGTILMFLWWIEFSTKNSESVMKGSQYGKTTGNTDTFYNENSCVSGYDTSTQQMVWRGIEDFVGNGDEWEDGSSGDGKSGGIQYVSDDYTLYDEFSSSGSKMSALSFNSPTASGCLEALGWDKTKPFLCKPIATRVDTTYSTGFCDYATSSYVTSYRGANYYDLTYAGGGISFFAGSSSYMSMSGETGCRLVLNV